MKLEELYKKYKLLRFFKIYFNINIIKGIIWSLEISLFNFNKIWDSFSKSKFNKLNEFLEHYLQNNFKTNEKRSIFLLSFFISIEKYHEKNYYIFLVKHLIENYNLKNIFQFIYKTKLFIFKSTNLKYNNYYLNYDKEIICISKWNTYLKEELNLSLNEIANSQIEFQKYIKENKKKYNLSFNFHLEKLSISLFIKYIIDLYLMKFNIYEEKQIDKLKVTIDNIDNKHNNLIINSRKNDIIILMENENSVKNKNSLKYNFNINESLIIQSNNNLLNNEISNIHKNINNYKEDIYKMLGFINCVENYSKEINTFLNENYNILLNIKNNYNNDSFINNMRNYEIKNPFFIKNFFSNKLLNTNIYNNVFKKLLKLKLENYKEFKNRHLKHKLKYDNKLKSIKLSINNKDFNRLFKNNNKEFENKIKESLYFTDNNLWVDNDYKIWNNNNYENLNYELSENKSIASNNDNYFSNNIFELKKIYNLKNSWNVISNESDSILNIINKKIFKESQEDINTSNKLKISDNKPKEEISQIIEENKNAIKLENIDKNEEILINKDDYQVINNIELNNSIEEFEDNKEINKQMLKEIEDNEKILKEIEKREKKLKEADEYNRRLKEIDEKDNKLKEAEENNRRIKEIENREKLLKIKEEEQLLKLKNLEIENEKLKNLLEKKSIKPNNKKFSTRINLNNIKEKDDLKKEKEKNEKMKKIQQEKENALRKKENELMNKITKEKEKLKKKELIIENKNQNNIRILNEEKELLKQQNEKLIKILKEKENTTRNDGNTQTSNLIKSFEKNIKNSKLIKVSSKNSIENIDKNNLNSIENEEEEEYINFEEKIAKSKTFKKSIFKSNENTKAKAKSKPKQVKFDSNLLKKHKVNKIVPKFVKKIRNKMKSKESEIDIISKNNSINKVASEVFGIEEEPKKVKKGFRNFVKGLVKK